MNKTELQAKVKEAIDMNQKTINGCYATVGKLVVSRDCTEEQAKEKIDSEKQLVSYFTGYGKALEFIGYYVDQLQMNENKATKEGQ